MWFILCLILDLSVDVETTFTSATVKFRDQNPDGVIRYKAFVGAVGGTPRCSVPTTAAHIRCTITGLDEAVDFELHVQACRTNVCERDIMVYARTKLQGSFLVFTNL